MRYLTDFSNKKLALFIATFFIINFSLSAQVVKDVSGTITNNDLPIPDVNIKIKGTVSGTNTDSDGNYNIKVKQGGILEYTHIGFNPVSIVIEDITTTLNIKLVQKTNKLDEAVVKARKTQRKALEFEQKMDVDLKTPFGTFNPKKTGFAIVHIQGSKLNLAAESLPSALNGKFAGLNTTGYRLKNLKYVVDGVLSVNIKQLNLADIKDVYIVKNKLLAIVTTHNSFRAIQEKKNKIAEQYKNQNYYNDDAVVVSTDNLTTNSLSPKPEKIELKKIFGIITHLNKPISDVNIRITATSKGTNTDANGNYKLEANVGDEIIYSHTSLQTMTILVEDITGEINMDMLSNTNALDEVVVMATTPINAFENGVLERAKKAEKKIMTSRGTIDPKKATYPIKFIDGNDIKPFYSSITEAVVSKIPGARMVMDPVSGKLLIMIKPSTSIVKPLFAIWDVDGQIFTEDPPISVDNIKSIHVLKTLSATTRYGSTGAGGVIVIRTKSGTFDLINDKRNKITEQYTNNVYYNNDATTINTEDLLSNNYTKTIEAFNNKQEAYLFYNKNLKSTIANFDIHISIAQKFLAAFNDKNKTISILNNLASKHEKNPEILKAIAYNLQAINATKDALEVFKKVARLRPGYAQSYRDLANAYKENNEFKMSWRIYMNYLMNRNADKAYAVDQIVYNEMEYLYFNRENQTDIKEQFVPNNESKIKFRNDVRFVAEWNTSEAEFDLEFVGPDKRVYEFDHTQSDSQSLITSEKLRGYSSDEFFIEDVGSGEWLLNLTYYGNKKSAPTYLKITTYYNWGKPKQHQEIAVYKLEKEDLKMHFEKINSQTLLAFN